MESKTVKVNGYNEVCEKAENLTKEGKNVYVLFCGSKDKNGKSWCPDCVTAEPIVSQSLKNMPENSVYIYCSVGEREYWKNKENEFRVDPKLNLKGVPTFLKWGNWKEKLVEDQLFKPDLIKMMFED